MSHWANKMQESENAAREAWDRMMSSRAAGNKRAENKAWKENQKHRDDAARFRAMANPFKVSADGFAS